MALGNDEGEEDKLIAEKESNNGTNEADADASDIYLRG